MPVGVYVRVPGRIKKRGKMASVTCSFCGKTWEILCSKLRARGTIKFCSRECNSNSIIAATARITHNCGACGVPFERLASRTMARFCSAACAKAHGTNTTHGRTDTREYSIWTNMKTRCLNPNSDDYHLYGGRGIYICQRWLKDFSAFLEDMGECPPRMTLERLNTNGPYSPENCSWETQKTQQNNRRNNKRLTNEGRTMTLAQWSEELSIPYRKLRSYLKLGRDVSFVLNPKNYEIRKAR